jgi:hypothetical protein
MVRLSSKMRRTRSFINDEPKMSNVSSISAAFGEWSNSRAYPLPPCTYQACSYFEFTCLVIVIQLLSEYNILCPLPR